MRAWQVGCGVCRPVILWHGKATGISCGGSRGSSSGDSPAFVTPRDYTPSLACGMDAGSAGASKRHFLEEGGEEPLLGFWPELDLNLAKYYPINSGPKPTEEDDEV